jgi:GAF domain-containing protein
MTAGLSPWQLRLCSARSKQYKETYAKARAFSPAKTGTVVLSESLADDQRWPRFGPKAADLGVRSALSIPLIADDDLLGVTSVYTLADEVLHDDAVLSGEAFAAPAALALQNAQAFARAIRRAAQLQTSLSGRIVIERAIGLMMSRNCTEDQAMARLQRMSRHEHQPLAVVAQAILDEALTHTQTSSGILGSTGCPGELLWRRIEGGRERHSRRRTLG